MASAEQMLFEFADELNTKTQSRRRAVIEPPIGEYGDREIFADTATVMSPASLTIQDSKGSMDLSNIPSMLQKVADQIVASTGKNVSVDTNDDSTEEMKRIEMVMEQDEELRRSVLDLARMMELKMDNLTDTSSLMSKRQIEEARRTTMAMTKVNDTQEKMFDYQKDKDFDDARPIQTPTVISTDNDIPEMDGKQKGTSGGLFGSLMGGKAGRGGRFARILGFAGRGLLGFGLALTVADAITKQFFGKDLLTAVKDGFSYILDNWDKLLVKSISGLFDVIMDLPSLIGQALSGLGKIIGSIILSVLNKIPIIGDMLPKDIDEMFKKDANGQDYFDRNSGMTTVLGTGAAAALVGTNTGRSAIAKTANLLTGGLVGKLTSPASLAEGASKAPSSTKPGYLSKGFQALKSSKYGKLLVGAALTAGAISNMFGDDEEEQNPEVEQRADTGVKVDTDSGMGMALPATAAAAAALGTGAYAYKNRSQARMTTPAGLPDKPQMPLPKPTAGAGGLGSDIMKPGAKGLGKGVLKTLGRIPGLSILMGGLDAFSTYNDDTLTDQQKNKEYAGVGGMLAGGAAGAALGSLLGPVGTVVGGALGAYLGEDGVEAIYDWFTGPDASEGQSITDTGVGKENIRNELRTVDPELQAQLNSIPGIPDIKSETNDYIGPYAPDYTPTVDEQVMYAKDVAEQISSKSLGTTKVETAQNYVEKAIGINPEVNVSTSPVSSYSEQLADADTIVPLSPEAVSSNTMLETGIEDNQDIRSQTANIPEVTVKVEYPPAPTEKKRQGVVAKKVVANKPTEKSRTGFGEKPSLNNVPMIIDDTGFILLNQGYV